MTNELAASIIVIASQYVDADKRIPDHVRSNLQLVAMADTIAVTIRRDAARLLQECAA